MNIKVRSDRRRKFYSLTSLAERWPFYTLASLRRKAADGSLPTIRVGWRYFVPRETVEQIEKEGLK